MSSRKPVTISLSEEMIVELDRVRTSRDRSRSEIVDEALRWYFRSIPVETPTPEELAAMEEGCAAIERGDYVSFEQLLHDLDVDRRQTGAEAT
jgi:predicted transcriptional regulator